MFTILQNANPSLRYRQNSLILTVVLLLPLVILTSNASAKAKFQVEEATIANIHKAIKGEQITTTELVRLYLDLIKAYNGVCVNQPDGILGPISTIANAGQLNALMTLNLRPDTRIQLGFDDRKARSMTDLADSDPLCLMP
jgi:amidase